MRRVFVFCLLLSAFGLPVWADFGVSLRAIDGITGQGEPYATVRLYLAADTTRVLQTGVTDGDGYFSSRLASPTCYCLRVTAVGKVEQQRSFCVTEAEPDAQLGEVVLPTADNVLEGVTVTAMKPLVTNEIDRLNYDVQNDADSRTLTTLDMLRKVPLVSVDAQDEIRVKGSTSFRIYRNGHPDPSLSGNAKNVLKAIPANTIKRIEVITDPGAKYDAEGVGAILNIVMMESTGMGGVTGTVTAGINNYGCPNVSTYLTARCGKFVTSVNYGLYMLNRSAGHQGQDMLHRYADGSVQTSMTDSRTDVTAHHANIEASYEADTLNLFTMSVGGYYARYGADSFNRTARASADGTTLFSLSAGSAMPHNNYYSIDGRADYQHRTHTPDETLTLSYMLSASRGIEQSDVTLTEVAGATSALFDYTGYANHSRETFREHTAQFDWTRPFAKYNKVETGLKYIYRLNRSHTQMAYQGGTMADVDSRFRHITQVGAAYLSYTYSHGGLTARAGVRYEWSRLRATFPDGSQPGFCRNLNDVVPSSALSYQFNPANSVKLTYATTIARPGITFLNPAVQQTPTTVSYGNARLSSARVHSLSVNYMHISRRFTVSLTPNVELSNNAITTVQWSEGGKEVSTYANTLRTRSGGMYAYVQWQPIAVTSVMCNVGVRYASYRSKALQVSNSRWATNFFVNLTQQLPWHLRLSAFAGQWGGDVYNLYSRGGTAWFYGFGLQASLLKDDRLTIRLSANSPFSRKFMTWKVYTEQGDYTGYDATRFVQRGVSLSVSYRFGSLNVSVKKTSKTITNDDVVGGADSGAQVGGGSGGGVETGGRRGGR